MIKFCNVQTIAINIKHILKLFQLEFWFECLHNYVVFRYIDQIFIYLQHDFNIKSSNTSSCFRAHNNSYYCFYLFRHIDVCIAWLYQYFDFEMNKICHLVYFTIIKIVWEAAVLWIGSIPTRKFGDTKKQWSYCSISENIVCVNTMITFDGVYAAINLNYFSWSWMISNFLISDGHCIWGIPSFHSGYSTSQTFTLTGWGAVKTVNFK